jgi:nitrogen fixation protein FixH
MLGWMMVFALITIFAMVISMKLAMAVFGTLFIVCLLTSVARGRA